MKTSTAMLTGALIPPGCLLLWASIHDWHTARKVGQWTGHRVGKHRGMPLYHWHRSPLLLRRVPWALVRPFGNLMAYRRCTLQQCDVPSELVHTYAPDDRSDVDWPGWWEVGT